jgi:hypothetical protein
MATGSTTAMVHQTDKQILGYSRYVVFAAAFLSMANCIPNWQSGSSTDGRGQQWSTAKHKICLFRDFIT